ncbi:MAG: energy transducer TonB [Janthinobacterium lividum]
MSFFQSLTASLDDVVFEGRNQAYGAYQLRQDYRRHLASAGGITLGLGLLLWLVGLAWPTVRPQIPAFHSVVLEPISPSPTIIEHPHVAPAAPRPAARAAAAPHVAGPAMPTQIVPDHTIQPPATLLPPTTPVDATAGPATPTTNGLAAAGTATGTATGSLTGSETGSDKGADASGEAAGTAAAPFGYVEHMPEFAGGQAALLRYLGSHMRYPTRALRDQTEGRVYLSFVVRADGTIAEAAIVKGLSPELDDEALRVVRQMPAWTPGYQNKHAVAVRFTLPITFKIQ